jgi:hypothetical protein
VLAKRAAKAVADHSSPFEAVIEKARLACFNSGKFLALRLYGEICLR